MIKILLKPISFSLASAFILLASNVSFAELCDGDFQWTPSGEFHSGDKVRFKGLAYEQKVKLTKGVQPDTNSSKWKSLGVCAAVKTVTCDFNGDGQMDSAKGFPYVDLIGGTLPNASAIRENQDFFDTGEVSITYSDNAPNQPANTIWNQNGLGMFAYASSGALFGFSLVVGDFNHDNFCDLAIGAPSYQGKGMINILYGSPNGLTTIVLGENGRPINPYDAQRFDQNSPNIAGGAEVGDEFGSALAAGDFNGDGYSDLAIGVPGESVESIAADRAGYVHVLYGSNVGIQTIKPKPAAYLQRISGTQELDAESDDNFGYKLVAADFDKDGYSDLVIPAPGEDAGTGRITVLRGSPSGLDVISQQDFNEDTFKAGSAHPSHWFGNYIAITDFNTDGYPDLSIDVFHSFTEHNSYDIPGSAFGLVVP